MATREEIIRTLVNAFHDIPYAKAMWEGGSAAFDRADQWSDIDLALIVDDGREKEAMLLVEDTLEQHSGIKLQFPIDLPHRPDMMQTFFELKDTDPFLLIDFSVLPASEKDKFLEPEIHGRPVVHFDKSDITSVPVVDIVELKEKLIIRIEKQKLRFEIFRTLVDKEVLRSNDVDAFIFYFSYTLGPLVEMLRIRYSIYHWNFGSRYLKYDLPPDIAVSLRPLYFVHDLDDLRLKNAEARAWYTKAAGEAEEYLVLKD